MNKREIVFSGKDAYFYDDGKTDPLTIYSEADGAKIGILTRHDIEVLDNLKARLMAKSD